MMKFIKTVFSIGLICIMLTACTESPKRVEVKVLPHLNATGCLFDMPLVELRDTVRKLFSLKYQMGNKILETVFMDGIAPKHMSIQVAFTPETIDRSVFGTEYFKKPGTSGDIFLTSMGGYWYSPVYHHDKDAFLFISTFALKFKRVSDKSTFLSVIAIDPEISNGTKCCTAHGNYSMTEKVKPTTIEEYILITFIADKLGIKNLKPIERPR